MTGQPLMSHNFYVACDTDLYTRILQKACALAGRPFKGLNWNYGQVEQNLYRGTGPSYMKGVRIVHQAFEKTWLVKNYENFVATVHPDLKPQLEAVLQEASDLTTLDEVLQAEMRQRRSALAQDMAALIAELQAGLALVTDQGASVSPLTKHGSKLAEISQNAATIDAIRLVAAGA